MTDAELLQRFVTENHEDSFSELVRRRIDLVYAAALRQLGGDTHRAEDITQQVFIDLARKARTLTSHPSLLAWLYTSTHYAAAKFIRTEQRRQCREEEAHIMDQLTRSSTPATDWERLRPLLDGAMHDLDERDRQIVLMRFFDRQTFGAIGAELGITENAAQKSAERALDRLHALLTRRGITSTSGALAALFVNQAVVSAPAGLAASITTTALAEATAVTAVAGAFGAFLQLMNTTYVNLSLAALTVVGVGVGLYHAVAAQQADALAIAANHDADKSRAHLRDMAARRGNGESALKSPGAQNASQIASAPATAAPQNVVSTVTTAAIVRDLTSDPYFNELMVEKAKAEIGEGHGLLYHDLKLTADQIRQFEELLLKAKLDAWEIHMAVERGERTATDPTTRELLHQSWVRLENGLRGVLGEAGLQRFQDYDRASGVQAMVDNVAGRVYFTETPLTADQASQLAQILARNSPEFRRGGFFKMQNLDWDHVIAEANSFLPAGQVAALNAMRIANEYYRELAAATKSAGKDTP